jgi:polyisoprenoid-binding protein YceI
MTTEAAVNTYSIDAMHSTADFSVKHLMVSTVKGRFKQLEGTVYLDDADPSRSSVEATIDVASVDTGVEMRDNDLRSENFFAADRFPTIRFVSSGVKRVDNGNWRVRGDLTIRDVTREVVLDTEFEGRGKGFQGEERLGFTAQTTLNRHDFSLSYNAVLETGGVVVGDKVKVTLHIEAVKQD